MSDRDYPYRARNAHGGFQVHATDLEGRTGCGLTLIDRVTEPNDTRPDCWDCRVAIRPALYAVERDGVWLYRIRPATRRHPWPRPQWTHDRGEAMTWATREAAERNAANVGGVVVELDA